MLLSEIDNVKIPFSFLYSSPDFATIMTKKLIY